MHQRSDVNNEDFAKTIQKAIAQIAFIPGEFHIELHMMAVVYMFSCIGFLQPLQTLINWKGISKDPSAAYKKNCELAYLVYYEMVRLQCEQFKEWLVEQGDSIKLLKSDLA